MNPAACRGSLVPAIANSSPRSAQADSRVTAPSSNAPRLRDRWPAFSIACAAAIAGLLWGPAVAEGQGASVTITGGVEPDGHYQWVVENRGVSPVISIEFPQIAMDVFTAPPGWRWKKEATTCRAWADPTANGIQRGGKASFVMQVRQLTTQVGRGTVNVGLGDGTTLAISDVQVPRPPSLLDRFGMLICCIILGGILAIIAVRRRRREQRVHPPVEPDVAPPPAGS